MADKLLSQADVDAMVGSLTRNKAETKPATMSTPVINKSERSPGATPPSSTTNAASARAANDAATMRQKPVPQVRQEQQADVSVTGLTAKVGELTKQLGQMTATLQRMDARMSQLETYVMKTQESQGTARQVQHLTEEFKKVLLNLQGTPGYGIHHSFHCEKCDEHGTVATVFRCTKCGKETWRGWWPAKQK